MPRFPPKAAHLRRDCLADTRLSCGGRHIECEAGEHPYAKHAGRKAPVSPSAYRCGVRCTAALYTGPCRRGSNTHPEWTRLGRGGVERGGLACGLQGVCAVLRALLCAGPGTCHGDDGNSNGPLRRRRTDRPGAVQQRKPCARAAYPAPGRPSRPSRTAARTEGKGSGKWLRWHRVRRPLELQPLANNFTSFGLRGIRRRRPRHVAGEERQGGGVRSGSRQS